MAKRKDKYHFRGKRKIEKVQLYGRREDGGSMSSRRRERERRKSKERRHKFRKKKKGESRTKRKWEEERV